MAEAWYFVPYAVKTSPSPRIGQYRYVAIDDDLVVGDDVLWEETEVDGDRALVRVVVRDARALTALDGKYGPRVDRNAPATLAALAAPRRLPKEIRNGKTVLDTKTVPVTGIEARRPPAEIETPLPPKEPKTRAQRGIR